LIQNVTTETAAGRRSPATWRGTALTAFSAVTFGLGTTFARIAYEAGSNPPTAILLRVVVFIAVIGVLIAVMRRPMQLSAPAFLHTLWMSATLMMVSLGYMGSVNFIPVTLAAVLFYTFPLLVGLLAAATGRERMTIIKAAALAVAFLGLTLALGGSFGALDWRGIALAMTGALGMALTVTYGGDAMRGQDLLAMNFYTNLWMLIGLVLVLAIAGGFALPGSTGGGWALAGVCASYLFAFVSWFLAMRLVEPVRVASLFNIEPVATIVFAWAMLDERLTPVQLCGAALVIASIVAVTVFDRRRGAG
jgi:drug/metabolite transporter (DMT)-like permease